MVSSALSGSAIRVTLRSRSLSLAGDRSPGVLLPLRMRDPRTNVASEALLIRWTLLLCELVWPKYFNGIKEAVRVSHKNSISCVLCLCYRHPSCFSSCALISRIIVYRHGHHGGGARPSSATALGPSERWCTEKGNERLLRLGMVPLVPIVGKFESRLLTGTVYGL